MRPIHHPAVKDLSLAAVLHALADPIRLEIVRRLGQGGAMSCTVSCESLTLPKATLSRHYDVLRSAGLVFTTRAGAQYVNLLRIEELNSRFPGLLDSILGQQPEPGLRVAPRAAAKKPKSGSGTATAKKRARKV